MEVPRLGVELELSPPASTTATGMPDLSQVDNLHQRSQQHQILNPLREARDPGIEPASSWILVRFITAEP